ncbi:polysaccharide biosynthesis protein [Chitinispirillum alkaliphilum]|nr:polysaccharide biosynthesis protein [Chitinispirillum alkaliphilum]
MYRNSNSSEINCKESGGDSALLCKDRNEFFETSHLKGDLKSRAVKGGFITIVARGIDFLVHMVGTVVLARLLSPQDFGLLAMVLALTGFFVIFKDMGLSDATVQSEKINHAQVSTLFWLNLLFGVLIFISAIVISPFVAWFYGEPRLLPITIISSVSFVFAGISIQHLALLRRNMKFSNIAVVEIGASVLSITVAISMALGRFGIWALVARPLVLALFKAVGMWLFCAWRPGLPRRNSGVRSLIRFGANTTGFYLINYFSRNLDKVLVGWAVGPVVLGFYHKAFHLFVLPVNQFSIPLQSVAVTTLTKLRNDPQQYKRYFLKALALLAFIGMPMSAYIASVGDMLILIMLGESWMGAADIFAVFGLGAGMQIIYAAQGWLHVSLGRADRWFRWGIFGSFCTVLFFLGGLRFGAVGVAAGYTLSLYVLTFPALWYAGKPIKLSLKKIWNSIWRYYLASVLAGVGSFILSKNMDHVNVFARLFMSTSVFLLLYLSFIVLLFRSFSPVSNFVKLVADNLPLRSKKIKTVDL